MKHTYSLAHLTALTTPPPAFIRAAAAAGYDAVSLRTLGGREDHAYDLAHDTALRKETERALRETGLEWKDAELLRITDDFNAAEHVPHIAAAAELGVRNITLTVPAKNRSLYTEKFIAICQEAARHGLTVNVEPIIWAGVSDIHKARELIENAGQENAGLLIDIYHFHCARTAPEELASIPSRWLHYVHMCDGPAVIPSSEEELRRIAWSGRPAPGEGGAGIRSIMRCMPGGQNLPVVLEIPNAARLEEMGLESYARMILQRTKEVLEDQE